MTNLLINTAQFKGMEVDEMISYICERSNNITVSMLRTDITVLGGTAPAKSATKKDYAVIYVNTLKAFAENAKKNKKAKQQSAASETLVAEQNKPKEESTMTQNNQPQYVTQQELTNQMKMMMDGLNANIQLAMEAQTQRTEAMIAQLSQRIDGIALNAPAQQVIEADPQARIRSLVQQLNAHYGYELVTQATPVNVLENLAASLPQTTAKPVAQPVVQPTLDPNAVVYSPIQIDMLEDAKKKGQQYYENLKTTMDNGNRYLGRTVGNMLSGTAQAVNTGGHTGVDTVADFVSNTIDTAKGLIYKATDLTAEVAHAATNVTRNAGHVIINGVVYVVDGAGRVVGRK